MAYGSVQIDESALDDLLNDPEGPVGQLLADLDEQAAAIARGVVHVWPGTRRSTIWNPATSTAVLPSGTTKASIHTYGPVRGKRGLYGGVNAKADPTVYLEKPADQMHHQYPFLTFALNTLELE